jgi:bifunctional non-homologous end joining protein LigD
MAVTSMTSTAMTVRVDFCAMLNPSVMRGLEPAHDDVGGIGACCRGGGGAFNGKDMLRSAMALEDYRRKRDFGKTAEPKGGAVKRGRTKGLIFVIQKHAARRLHYDFRLEWDGVLKSWAVPKGPSLDPAEKRLAVQVEDHPIEYGAFEGTIPEDEYGRGTVMLWDRGTWEPLGDAEEGFRNGHLKFKLNGARCKGRWALIEMRGARSGGGKNWLLIKEHDAAEKPGHGDALVARYGRSVASRRSMEGIAKAGARVWRSTPRASAFEARNARLVERARKAGPKPPIPGARPARLPAKPKPALARLADAPPAGDTWLHEIKLDGYRMLARISSGTITMLSRNGIDWTGRFPKIEAALLNLPVESAVIDGEVVHLDQEGRSSFSALKDDLSAGRTGGLVFYAFDLLYCDGQSLERARLLDRKAALERLLEGADRRTLRFSAHVLGAGARVFAEACKMKLEGIVSKRIDAPYRAGRVGDWIKVKCQAREEFILLGWTDPAGKRQGLGALLLGYYDGTHTLRYAGAVGTGFTAKTLAALRRKLDRIAAKAPPSAAIAKEAPKGAHWVRPELVAEIQYTEWTEDGRLRHPSFQALREDKEPDEVVPDRIKSTAAPPPAAPVKRARGAVEVAGVRLTHPEKLLFEAAKITKLDLARYFVDVAEQMLPHVRGRPLTLMRCPDGAGGKCFFQKHPGASAPDELKRIEIVEKDGPAPYLIADDVAGLVSLVQMGVLEVHVWGSTAKALDEPDRIIFDLDPDVGLPWERVIAGALAVRDLLAEMNLASWPKATGGKGLHIVLPIRPKYDWEDVKAFAYAVASELVRRAPDCYTGAMPKKDRRGKIFVDYLRNQRGATAIAPFSARGRPEAPVAVPISWKEVEQGVHGNAFTLLTVRARLETLKRDPWEGFFDAKQQLPVAVMRKLR